MISRSDWEPLPTPTLSPFARGYLSLCRFFTAAVWCVPALSAGAVGSFSNKPLSPKSADVLVGPPGDFMPEMESMRARISIRLCVQILCHTAFFTTGPCS